MKRWENVKMSDKHLREQWVAVVSGYKVGPIKGSMLLRLITGGVVEADMMIRRENENLWTPVTESPFKDVLPVSS